MAARIIGHGATLALMSTSPNNTGHGGLSHGIQNPPRRHLWFSSDGLIATQSHTSIDSLPTSGNLDPTADTLTRQVGWSDSVASNLIPSAHRARDPGHRFGNPCRLYALDEAVVDSPAVSLERAKDTVRQGPLRTYCRQGLESRLQHPR